MADFYVCETELPGQPVKVTAKSAVEAAEQWGVTHGGEGERTVLVVPFSGSQEITLDVTVERSAKKK